MWWKPLLSAMSGFGLSHGCAVNSRERCLPFLRILFDFIVVATDPTFESWGCLAAPHSGTATVVVKVWSKNCQWSKSQINPGFDQDSSVAGGSVVKHWVRFNRNCWGGSPGIDKGMHQRTLHGSVGTTQHSTCVENARDLNMLDLTKIMFIMFLLFGNEHSSETSSLANPFMAWDCWFLTCRFCCPWFLMLWWCP